MMPRVLVHISESEGVVGLWRINGESLESYYPTKRWEKRGKDIMADKSEKTSADDYFDRLKGKSPYMDHFGEVESREGEPLQAVYYRVRRDALEE
jgi:hypothetical protein